LSFPSFLQLLNDQSLTEGFDETIFELPTPDMSTMDGVNPTSSTVPVTSDHPGEYGFQLQFQKTGTAKSVTSTVSNSRHGLSKVKNDTYLTSRVYQMICLVSVLIDKTNYY